MDESQNPNPDNLKPADEVVSRSADATPPAEVAPPLTPAAWLANNAGYLILIGAVVGLTWYKLGLEGVWSISKVVLGLGFVIFIHELGHFLAAKWCDVHVQTFSIGFGPALPGCSFQRGETTYKISVLPLGGYVNMVGEGLEGEEDEDYPRSFKNKTVGQRMLIISAGVVMNVILGCILFIVVYYYHGVMLPPAVVGRVDAGSPLWQKGIPSGTRITNLAGVEDPSFKTLQRKVILSAHGEVLPFTLQEYGTDGKRKGEPRTVGLLPRLGADDPNPLVGVSPPSQLRLHPKPRKELDILPVLKDSPAAAARPIPVKEGEVVVAATDPDNPDTVTRINHDLKAGTFDFRELSRRVKALKGKKMLVGVLPKGSDEKAKPDEREVPLEGFQWNDTIVGCTEVQTDHEDGYNPFRVSGLPRDPRHRGGDQRDPFAFRARLRQLLGMPMVIQVRRGDPNNTSLRQNPSKGPVVNLFVPPAYHFTFGMRMKMGKVAGVREGSPAARAGVRKGDEIIKVAITDAKGNELGKPWEDLDPERLPFQLAQEAGQRPGQMWVKLTVRREPSESDRTPKDITCDPVEWEDRWDNDIEVPIASRSPLAIPQLGVAYWVLSQVVEVKPNSPAAKKGLKKGDTLTEYRMRELSRISKELDWSEWTTLKTKRNGNDVYDRWAWPFRFLQSYDYKEIQVKKRLDEEVTEPITLTAVEDRSWPLVSRGLKLLEDYKLQKADSLGEALVMGGRETGDMIAIMYLQLRSLVTGRVSVKGMAGPIGMGVQGFFIAQSGNFELLLFLGIISINLAVVNFLPIPILDGGHMVFLIYEKLRGQPPAEKVKAIATYIGLAMIGFLMLFVFYQDIQNYVIKKFGG